MRPLLALPLVAALSAPSACTPEDDPAAADVGQATFDVRACADGPTVRGIDVSYYQGSIDWAQVRASGIEFAVIRVSDGTGFVDPRFDANWAGARAAGVIRGTYQFFRPNQDAVAQADLLLDRMGALEDDDLPPVIDVEATGGQSPAVVSAKIRQWVDRVQAATGRTPIVYTGKYFWQDNVGSADFADLSLWVAQWGPVCPDLPDPWTRWDFHQTSDDGSVPGIAGAVDTDLWNGDRAALLAYARGRALCGDGACNGDETSDTCPGDCPVCGQVPAAGRIVDDAEVCFAAGGDPRWIRHVGDAGWERSLQWTHTTDAAAEENFGRWRLDFAEAGRYRVEAYTPASHAQSRQAAYVVRHAGGEDRAVVDQTVVDGWSLVGELEFAAGGDQWVHVGDNTGEPLAGDVQLVFDALRVTRLYAPPPPGGGEPPPGGGEPPPDGTDEMSGGCAVASTGNGAGGSPSAWAWLALGLVAMLARRGRRGC